MDGEQICRTCLRSDNLAPIFARAENHERYTVALFLTTGLQIEMNDGLPQSICKECRDLINIAIEFRNQGHKSEQTLLRWGFSRRTTHSLHQERMKEFYQHIDMKLSAKLKVKKESPDTIEPIEGGTSVKVEFEVENDEKPFINNSLKDEQIDEPKIEYDAQPVSDDDHFDDSAFKQEPSQRKSYWSEDSFEFVGEPKTKSKIPRPRKRAPKIDTRRTYGHLIAGPAGRSGPYKCKACGKILKNMCSFRCHAKLHMDIQFMCEYCGKIFATVQNLKRHRMSQHNVERTYRCRFCDYATWDSQRLKIHERREHTGEKPYVCDTCGNGFYNRNTIVHHMTVHLTARNIQCTRCPSTFRTKQDLQCHNARVHKPKGPRVECYVCRKTYSTKCVLREHVYKKHGIKLPMTKNTRRRYKKVVTMKSEPESRSSHLTPEMAPQEFTIENQNWTYTPVII